jgi:aminotransferase
VEHIFPLITKNTGAIIVVHYAGLPVNMKPIVELGIPVIEDCAHAVDSYLNGVHCGALGDVGVFSFDSMKNLSVGEGGGITAASPTFIEKAKRFRYCGIAKSGIDASKEKERWWETEVLFNSLRHMPNDVSASIALAQLKKLDKFQETRKHIWEFYKRELEQDLKVKDGWAVKGYIGLPRDPEPNMKHSYFTYFIRINLVSRDGLANYLLSKGIYTTLRYFPLHMMKLFKSHPVQLPNTELLNKTGLNIPMHARLTDEDLKYITDQIKYYLL